MEVNLIRNIYGRISYNLIFNPETEKEIMLKHKIWLDQIVQDQIDLFVKISAENKLKGIEKAKITRLKNKEKKQDDTNKESSVGTYKLGSKTS